MRIEIVEDHDIAFAQHRRQLRFDIGVEGGSIHGAVDNPWRDDAVASKPCNESLRMPFAERRGLSGFLCKRGTPACYA